ncbi:MAG: PAS domain S-box protein, partial [Actinomycetota bacterium]|nr:PAS domain S-box protein [Actinomycetota bacterium]
LRRSWETGEPWEDTFPLRGGDGSYRWFLSRARPIRDGSGRIVRWFGTNTDVTEQREARRALAESEERFRATFEQAAVGVAHVAPDGRWLRVNDRLCRIVGYGHEELAGMTFEDIIHPDDLKKDLGQVSRLLAGEIATYSMEKRYLRKDGSAVSVDLTVSLVRDESGEPGYFIGVIEDITERRRAEEALRRQAELLELSHEPIFAWELGGGGIVYWNRGAEELYGFSREEAVGSESHRLLGTVHPISLERFEAELERDGRWVGELVHATRDGRRVVVESRHELVETSDGRRLVLETNRDVTERKEAEEALKESEERLRLLVRNSSDVISVFDADGTVVYQSPSIERVLGHRPEDRTGKNVFGDPLVHPDDLADLRAFFAEARANPGADAAGEFRLGHADGSWRHIEALGRNLLDEPSVAGIVVNYRDVTGRKQAEEALDEIREAERRRISRDLHDVVLQDLSGALQGLQLARLRAESSGADPEDLGEEIEALRRAAAGLRGAVYDLRLRRERPFVRAVEDLVESERRATPQREVALSVGEGFPEGLPERSGVELLLVLGEALANARRHSGAGRVGVVLGADGGRARVEVSDDGRGFRPGESPETPVGGVGLSAMRERVEALGGELEIRSRPGGGTRVTALVPFS